MLTDRDEVVGLLRELLAVNRAILQALAPDAQARTAATAVADDRDLDSKYGDPEVRSKVRRWDGPDMRGRRMSECPPEFLDVYAALLDWQAEQSDKKKETSNNGTPISKYRRQDAARARGWAARLRYGTAPKATPQRQYEPDPEFAGAGDFTPNDWR